MHVVLTNELRWCYEWRAEAVGPLKNDRGCRSCYLLQSTAAIASCCFEGLVVGGDVVESAHAESPRAEGLGYYLGYHGAGC